MNLLRHRVPGRHRADGVTPARPWGLASSPARHARRPRPQIVAEFTGWAGLARLCEDASKHPVVDVRLACPARAQFDPDQTIPFILEIPPMRSPRACTHADMALLLADITPTGGAA